MCVCVHLWTEDNESVAFGIVWCSRPEVFDQMEATWPWIILVAVTSINHTEAQHTPTTNNAHALANKYVYMY